VGVDPVRDVQTEPPQVPGGPPEGKGKVFGGVLLAIAAVVGLYFVNRYWIRPLSTRAVNLKVDGAAGGHVTAPEFSLSDIDGQKLDLADYRGKVVVLDFWATWCGPCRIEIPGFVELENRYRDQGLAVIGISLDDNIDPVRPFYKEFRMNYPVALGDNKLAELYGGIYAMPTTFLIGRDGRIYRKHLGATDPDVFEEEIKELLAAKGDAEITKFQEFGRETSGDKVEVSTPAEVNSVVPGVDLTGLTPAQVGQFEKRLAGMQCNCGCGRNVLNCRKEDSGCPVSRKIAKDELAKFTKSKA
jgi:peroxiredoxin